MPSDPRRRAAAAAAAAGPAAQDVDEAVAPVLPAAAPSGAPSIGGGAKPSIFFASSDDAMMEEEEDEEIDLPAPSLSSRNAGVLASSTAGGDTSSGGGGARGDGAVSGGSAGAAVATDDRTKLLSKIITPSPYPQHHQAGGAASSRFRNALNRVATSPTTDAEAWSALITEVQTCYRNLQSVHAVDAETHARLDWMESCYGALLATFPYSSSHYVQVLEMLLAQSARVGEPNGPRSDYGRTTPTRRSVQCEAKVEAVLRTVLGVNMDGTSVQEQQQQQQQQQTTGGDGTSRAKDAEFSSQIGGMCTWCVELWLLYIQKAVRDANRAAQAMVDEDDRAARVRDVTQKAYETALSYAAFCHNNHLLWKQYLEFVRSWVPAAADDNNVESAGVAGHVLQQKQMVQLRALYQRLVCIPMTGLDQLWHEYEAFEKHQSEALAQALVQEFTPKYQHARTVYLERQRVYGDLQHDRLAVEPVYQTDGEDDAGGVGENKDEDFASKRQEEHMLLQAWKVRCAYERSNPERLSTKELSIRVRTAYMELACTWTRHPECWHMWSAWERLHAESLVEPDAKYLRARAVLQRGQVHIPDCTLLAYAEAQLIEEHHSSTDGKQQAAANECITVMEDFLRRSPNTLGFVLCQQMVRRYRGIDEARAIFARARRVLTDPGDSSVSDVTGGDSREKAEGVASEALSGDGKAHQADKLGNNFSHSQDNGKKRWMVTNRLDAAITGAQELSTKSAKQDDREDNSNMMNVPAGPITWHLYASHAVIEHRLNRSPEIAARVYELGLRKHSSFVTKPPYVLRYAQLLLELGDAMNLRALLTRAVSACESSPGNREQLQGALAAFWDMTLRFESLLSPDPASSNRLREIERKRRQAVVGADVEDVATGGSLATSEVALIGAQKSTISEQLVRSEGYDNSSNIVSGMSRAVDFLEVMGLWGNEMSSALLRQRTKQESTTEFSGGKSDASYEKRLHYQSMVAAGLSTESAVGEGGVAGAGGTKILSARERLQQGAAGTGGAGQGQPTAMMLAIQQSPDWIRPLLLLLPASRLRLPIVAKPPPHITELALSTLKQSQLPSERPADSTNGSNERKRMVTDGDSSDDEDNGLKVGGYGNQFRKRKQARLG